MAYKIKVLGTKRADINHVGFEVLATVTIKIIIIWDVMPCILVGNILPAPVRSLSVRFQSYT
jgi:hypothetical protein